MFTTEQNTFHSPKLTFGLGFCLVWGLSFCSGFLWAIICCFGVWLVGFVCGGGYSVISLKDTYRLGAEFWNARTGLCKLSHIMQHHAKQCWEEDRRKNITASKRPPVTAGKLQAKYILSKNHKTLKNTKCNSLLKEIRGVKRNLWFLFKYSKRNLRFARSSFKQNTEEKAFILQISYYTFYFPEHSHYKHSTHTVILNYFIV